MDKREELILKSKIDREKFIFNLKNNIETLENQYKIIFPNQYISLLEDADYADIIEDYIFCTEEVLIRENIQLDTANTSPKLISIGMTGDYDILAMKQEKHSKEIYLYPDGDFNQMPAMTFEDYKIMFKELQEEFENQDETEELYSLVITKEITDKKDILQLKSIIKYNDTMQSFLTGLRTLPFKIKENINSAIRDKLEQELNFIKDNFVFIKE